MFAATITITIDSVDKILNRINQDAYSSEYFLRGSTDDFRLKIRHTNYTSKTSGRVIDRHNVELVHTVYPVSPETVATVRKAYSVFEFERTDGVDDPVDFSDGFVGFLTNTNITKLMNYES